MNDALENKEFKVFCNQNMILKQAE